MNKIEKNNTFSLVTKKINAYKKAHPENNIVSLGIGDVSKPVCKPVIEAMHKAVDDLADMKTFQGYGAYYGLPSLRKLIAENDYKDFGFSIDEIFVGCGTKTDSTSILELFDKNAKILVGQPMYPIYKNAAYAMSRNVYIAPQNKNNKMAIPSEHYDIIYLVSPSNPTGEVLNKKELSAWVKYALKENAVILYDNVYEAFIHTPGLPHSIYEIKDAKKCAIEFRSYSKKASFTGLRCSYFVLPKELGNGIDEIWKERTINRFNGASYVAQIGAEATYSKKAQRIITKNMEDYRKNAELLRKGFEDLGFKVTGGVDAPYLWIKTNKDSWVLFDEYLEKLEVIITPGAIFGEGSRNYFRVSALGSRETCKQALERIRKYYEE